MSKFIIKTWPKLQIYNLQKVLLNRPSSCCAKMWLNFSKVATKLATTVSRKK